MLEMLVCSCHLAALTNRCVQQIIFSHLPDGYFARFFYTSGRWRALQEHLQHALGSCTYHIPDVFWHDPSLPEHGQDMPIRHAMDDAGVLNGSWHVLQIPNLKKNSTGGRQSCMAITLRCKRTFCSQLLNIFQVNFQYYGPLMPKTRIRGVRAPKNSKVKRPVSCGFTKRKKSGHGHIMFILKNTRRQDVHRCRVCKHHFIFTFIF